MGEGEREREGERDVVVLSFEFVVVTQQLTRFMVSGA